MEKEPQNFGDTSATAGAPPVYQAQPLEYPPPYYPTNTYPQHPGPVTTAPTQVVVISSSSYSFGNDSTRMTCPHCHAEISTKVNYTPSGLTHCAALVLCCFVCWPCAWIPYVVPSCQQAHHECPNCNTYLGHQR